MSDWIKIGDGLPSKSGYVALAVKIKKRRDPMTIPGFIGADGTIYKFGARAEDATVTHWMPLPEPPK